MCVSTTAPFPRECSTFSSSISDMGEHCKKKSGEERTKHLRVPKDDGRKREEHEVEVEVFSFLPALRDRLLSLSAFQRAFLFSSRASLLARWRRASPRSPASSWSSVPSPWRCRCPLSPRREAADTASPTASSAFSATTARCCRRSHRRKNRPLLFPTTPTPRATSASGPGPTLSRPWPTRTRRPR